MNSGMEKDGIPVPDLRLTRREYELLMKDARFCLRDPEAHIRWLIREHALGRLIHQDTGVRAKVDEGGMPVIPPPEGGVDVRIR